jgi:phosphoglycolate phosphatase
MTGCDSNVDRYRPRMGICVGFDLDMTLVDSRPGIRATCRALSAETGVWIDADAAVSRLGPPLEVELAHWFPAGDVDAMAARYRALYHVHGVPGTIAMPGAHDALAAVREVGGRSVVVTAKETTGARGCVAHAGLDVDDVAGLVWGAGKGQALEAHGAAVYVGDSPPDVVGARTAGAVAVAVTSGPHDATELREAGAEVVLGSLDGFRPWFLAWLARHG